MHQFRTAFLISTLIVGLGFGVTATPAVAQTHAGIRAGASVNPDQFYLGGHVETPPIADRLRFRPNVEIGVGNNVTLAAFNFEFIYPFASRQPWHVYAGGGPALNWYKYTGSSQTNGGLNLLVGLEHRSGLFFEAKIGAIDSPDLKFGVGYTFR